MIMLAICSTLQNHWRQITASKQCYRYQILAFIGFSLKHSIGVTGSKSEHTVPIDTNRMLQVEADFQILKCRGVIRKQSRLHVKP